MLTMLCVLMHMTQVFAQNTASNNDCVIHGKLEGTYKGKKVYLYEEKEINGASWAIDSCTVVDNCYTFTVKNCGEPKMFFIKSGDPECLSPITPFWVEKGEVFIKANASYFLNSTVTGTINNEIFNDYNATIKFYNDSLRRASTIDMLLKRSETPEEREKLFKARTDFLNNRTLQMQYEIVKNYPDQVIAPFIIFWEMKANVSLNELKELRAKVDSSLQNHPYTKQLDEFIRLADFKVGSEMPDFELPDKNGKTFKLSSLRGKYVLVDFWASWCGPCLRELPNVVQLYKECKGKNFEIVGISLDRNKDAWLKAIEKNKMKWIQVCDFLSWETETVKQCNIQGVPFTVLVDPEGKVAALDLRGENLHKTVKEFLSNKAK